MTWILWILMAPLVLPYKSSIVAVYYFKIYHRCVSCFYSLLYVYCLFLVFLVLVGAYSMINSWSIEDTLIFSSYSRYPH